MDKQGHTGTLSTMLLAGLTVDGQTKDEPIKQDKLKMESWAHTVCSVPV